ncbi:MAG TPA: DUF5722 domain-containing protein [Pirellulaceae bacterium]|nr:DUF5722 domain-containing protein [Pirellulaceae bacterium]
MTRYRRISTALALTWFASIALAGAGAIADHVPFPQPGSVKGLQVQMTDDALALGIRHAAINVSLGALTKPEGGEGSVPFQSGGREWFFDARYAAALDRQIKPLSDAGVVVYLILLAYPTGDPARDELLLHPDAPQDRSFTIAGFNTKTDEGKAFYRAAIGFLAERYGSADSEHGQVWGWIVGNEVNSQGQWYAIGEKSVEAAAGEYEQAVRLTREAVQAVTPGARVYVSLDHCWNVRSPGLAEQVACPGKTFLEAFARIAKERGDFDWHVAYHPYPDDLGNPRTWLDRQAWPTDDSPHVTFKNLEVLGRFLDRPQLQFEGKRRRVILSEQGIHCLASPEGERLQAAGFVYAWNQVAAQPWIDAMIWHRHVDHAREGGLRLGLYENEPGTIASPGRKRLIYDLFQAAGTDEWEAKSAFAEAILQPR